MAIKQSTKGRRNEDVAKAEEFPDIKAVEEDVCQYIVGQDKPIRQILTSMYRAMQFGTSKSHILVIGGSGTGKTETIKQIFKNLQIPYSIEDINKYTQGTDYENYVSKMISNLLATANMDLEKAQHGILVIDGIGEEDDEEKNFPTGVALRSLIRFIEQAEVKVATSRRQREEKQDNFNMKNLNIIFLANLPGLYKIRDARLNQFGFVTKSDGKQAAHFMKTDLQEFGMPDEMVRGVDTVVEMNKLTKGDLVSILKHSKLSVFRRYSAELHKLGVRLRYNESLFDCIAETSFSPETGARELSNTVNYMFEEIMYEVIANPKKYTSCTLSLDIVCDNTKYKLS